MKDAILAAAIEVVALHGLNNWTVEEVANRARCAKGLVNYHYRSKQDLLVQVAETIRDDRAARRLAAVQSSGAQALDRLWETLTLEMESGWFAARISLLATDGPLRAAVGSTTPSSKAFALALGRALDLGDKLLPRVRLIEATLDGLQLGMLQGATPAAAEEDYHRFWLTVLP